MQSSSLNCTKHNPPPQTFYEMLCSEIAGKSHSQRLFFAWLRRRGLPTCSKPAFRDHPSPRQGRGKPVQAQRHYGCCVPMKSVKISTNFACFCQVLLHMRHQEMACRGLSSGARAFFSLGGEGDRDGGSQDTSSFELSCV